MDIKELRGAKFYHMIRTTETVKHLSDLVCLCHASSPDVLLAFLPHSDL